VELSKHQPPQSALQNRTPIQAKKQWHESHPELFKNRRYNRPGGDIQRRTKNLATQYSEGETMAKSIGNSTRNSIEEMKLLAIMSREFQ